MIHTIEKKISINKELRSKIEWACTFSNCKPKIKNGNLRMVEKTNFRKLILNVKGKKIIDVMEMEDIGKIKEKFDIVFHRWHFIMLKIMKN